MREKMVKVGDLVIDPELTRMRPVNAVFVSRYRQAYRSGEQLPMPLVEAKTNRVVSGNHRVTALLEEYGEDHKIKVQSESFATESDVVKAFARENATHGNALSGSSRAALTIKLLQLGTSPEEVANIFGVSVRRVEEWGGHVVAVVGNGNKTEYRPVKAGVEATEMTQDQYAEHWQADRGISVIAQAEQLTRWLNNGWVGDDEETVQALSDLEHAIRRYMGDK
jgi:hypothetical protein